MSKNTSTENQKPGDLKDKDIDYRAVSGGGLTGFFSSMILVALVFAVYYLVLKEGVAPNQRERTALKVLQANCAEPARHFDISLRLSRELQNMCLPTWLKNHGGDMNKVEAWARAQGYVNDNPMPTRAGGIQQAPFVPLPVDPKVSAFNAPTIPWSPFNSFDDVKHFPFKR